MDAESFFKAYLALPVVMAFYVGGFIWKRGKWIKIADIDVDSGRRHLDWDAHEAHKAEMQSWGPMKRFWNKLF